MVDDSREEHRMLIFANDSDPVQDALVRDPQQRPQRGLLDRKVHEDSYTVTLYALLKDYGLTPIVRIKPRIRFRRFSYDNQSSSAPLRYGLDDIVHFAELKKGVETGEAVDAGALERIFGDAPVLEGLSEDPAHLLVAQRDIFLRQPPLKTKTKVFGQGSDLRGIPIGNFLEALNYPTRAERLFRPFPQGDEFAADLREALEPFGQIEFHFGMYSRYERRDCVLPTPPNGAPISYRTTFDPWTVMGHVRSEQDEYQLQVLSHERATRWEHKIVLDDMGPTARDAIGREIRALRKNYLIGRTLSKSQTCLTLLADARESRLGLVKELPGSYDLRVEATVASNRFGDIEYRRRLRRTFTSGGDYELHHANRDVIERHLNLAKGLFGDVVYTLDRVHLAQGPSARTVVSNGHRVVRDPYPEVVLLRSAEDLRAQLPASGFDLCWNEAVDEAGYTVSNSRTGRCYTVSCGRRHVGSIGDGDVTVEKPENYVSVRYLGISSAAYKASSDPSDPPVRPTALGRLRSMLSSARGQQREQDIIREMQELMQYLEAKQLV